jgi:hypothetical protein
MMSIGAPILFNILILQAKHTTTKKFCRIRGQILNLSPYPLFPEGGDGGGPQLLAEGNHLLTRI